jgi:hypothetical protein
MELEHGADLLFEDASLFSAGAATRTAYYKFTLTSYSALISQRDPSRPPSGSKAIMEDALKPDY